MDFIVRQADFNRWVLADLLQRPAGRIEQQRPGMFRIVPSDRFADILQDLTPHSFETLENALNAIEIVARGVCRIKEGEPFEDHLEDASSSLVAQSDGYAAVQAKPPSPEES